MKLLTLATLMSLGLGAHAATTYELTITNGGPMPLSPSVVYVHSGQEALARPGEPAPNGLVQLCQSGNAMARAMEIDAKSGVSFLAQTQGLILPGESRTIEVQVDDVATQSIQFETMYGKTKDICGVASFNSHSLQALKQHVTTKVVSKDDVIQTGAFLSPALPMGQSYLDSNACDMQATAIDCLRALSRPAPMRVKIHAAEPYLSSVTMFLERKYGASETQSLLLSGAGAIQFELKLKH